LRAVREEGAEARLCALREVMKFSPFHAGISAKWPVRTERDIGRTKESEDRYV